MSFRSLCRVVALSIALISTPTVAPAQSLEAQLEQQAAQQYRQLLDQARAKDALATPRNVDLQRLIRIQGRILPYTYAVNPLAREWRWEVNLLRSDQVNAFCMPGGKIAFYSGIIAKLDLTDDEIAIVMGHEMTHALREHGVEQAKKRMAGSSFAYIASAVVSSLFGINPYITNMGARMANGAIQLRFSRNDESEADRIGLELAARAGFDPRAGVVLWRKMSQLAKRAPPSWLSDHPADSNRIADIQALLPKVMPLYADVLHTTVDRLPPYRTTSAAAR